MIKGIGHVAYNTADMERALQFYCDILGFQKAFSITDDNGDPWINYLLLPGGQFLELFYNRPNMQENSAYSHLCLEVEDIHALAAHLGSKNVPLDSEPRRGKDSNWQCWAKDPDGNRIEFMQLMPASPQCRALKAAQTQN